MLIFFFLLKNPKSITIGDPKCKAREHRISTGQQITIKTNFHVWKKHLFPIERSSTSQKTSWTLVTVSRGKNSSKMNEKSCLMIAKNCLAERDRNKILGTLNFADDGSMIIPMGYRSDEIKNGYCKSDSVFLSLRMKGPRRGASAKEQKEAVRGIGVSSSSRVCRSNKSTGYI